jgi:hypothetical protein
LKLENKEWRSLGEGLLLMILDYPLKIYISEVLSSKIIRG